MEYPYLDKILMTLSKEQIEAKEKFMRWYWIHERDLLECARRWSAWRQKAHELGFKDKKIDTPWIFPDEGRFIKYMEIPRPVITSIRCGSGPLPFPKKKTNRVIKSLTNFKNRVKLFFKFRRTK